MKKLLVVCTLVLISCCIRATAIEIETPSAIRVEATFEKGRLLMAETSRGDLPIIHIRGTHAEMGRQYGALVGPIIEKAAQIFNADMVLPGDLSRDESRALVQKIWSRLKPHVPEAFVEELNGVVEGAALVGAELDIIDLVTPIVVSNISDMNNKESLLEDEAARLRIGELAFTCSSFAAWGKRTQDGKLWATRVLDWKPGTGTDRVKAITLYEPYDENGNRLNAYMTAGYIGFFGAIDGMNDKGVTVSEIGSENIVETLDGLPWTLLFRHVLENATSVTEAVAIIKKAPNTIGYNFVIGDGDAENFGTSKWMPGGAAVEVNGEHTAVFFEDDPAEKSAVWINADGEVVLQDGAPVTYGATLENAVFRADVAFDPGIRRTQTADNGPGNPDSDGNPLVGGSYKNRHISQYNALLALKTGAAFDNPYTGEPVFAATGQSRLIGAQEALEIAAAVTIPQSSVLTIAYAATDLEFFVSWESTDGGEWTTSFELPYIQLSLNELINLEK